MNNNLKHLSKELKSLGLNDASRDISSILKNAQESDDVQMWQAVIDEVQRPDPDQIADVAAKYVVKGVMGLLSAAEKLKGIPKEDIELALEIGSSVPGAIKGASINLEVIEKFSRDFNSLNKTAQMSWLNGVGRFGAGALKVIPIIGVVFSAALAIKNLYYGFVEYSKLSSLSSQIGLHWTDTLFADKIISKINEFSDNPEQLIQTVKVCKSASIFVDEAISLAANSIDFIKDLLFLIVEAAGGIGSVVIPPGWAAMLAIGSVDVGISFIIMIIEYYAESAAKEKYKVALGDIKSIAEKKIAVMSETKYEDWDDEALYSYLAS